MEKKSLFRDDATLTLLTFWSNRDCKLPSSTICLIIAESLEVLRLNFSPVNKIFLGAFSDPNTFLCSVCACANHSFWNLTRLYTLIIWNSRTTF